MTANTGAGERLIILKEKMLRLLPEQTRLETAVPGLALTRYDGETAAVKCFYYPIAALVVQGSKHSLIGSREAGYGEGQCMVVGLDMPGVFHVTRASPREPFLSLSVRLDRHIIAGLIPEMPASAEPLTAPPDPVAVAGAGAELIEAFTRLADLLGNPSRIPVFAPMILREIHYHLLAGAWGGCLRLFGSGSTRASRIARAVSRLRENFAEPLRIEELARLVSMAPSTFHRRFREVTGLSPLQFQKRLRLYEAERLMLAEGKNAGAAAAAVGYASVSQFNREYKRLFGTPPRRDVSHKTLAS